MSFYTYYNFFHLLGIRQNFSERSKYFKINLFFDTKFSQKLHVGLRRRIRKIDFVIDPEQFWLIINLAIHISSSNKRYEEYADKISCINFFIGMEHLNIKNV